MSGALVPKAAAAVERHDALICSADFAAEMAARFAAMRAEYPHAVPAVDQLETLHRQLADLVAEAEHPDEVSSILWDESEVADYTWAMIRLAMAIEPTYPAGLLDSLDHLDLDETWDGPGGAQARRYLVAMEKLIEAMRAQVEASGGSLDFADMASMVGDEGAFRADFDKRVDASRSILSPRAWRHLISGQNRIHVGLVGVQSTRQHADHIIAFLDGALSDFEGAVATLADERSLFTDVAVAAAIDGRLQRLADQAAAIAGSAEGGAGGTDELVILPFADDAQDALWPSDALRGLASSIGRNPDES